MDEEVDTLIQEIMVDLENITLEELQNNPTYNTVTIAYQKGYNEAMKFCTSKLDKINKLNKS